MNGPRIGSLFSGFGGLDIAVRAVVGGSVAWHSEIDPGACKILTHRYPDVPNLGDITTVDWSQVEPVDVITGGSPCQDLSHAGKRGGMTEGTRSNLWVNMRDAISHLRPSLVIWENVRGAYSVRADSELESREGCVGDGTDGPVLRALGRVLGDLADLGFDAEWVGLRAADVGAPHGRFRVFVAAWPAADADHTGRREHGWPVAVRAEQSAAERRGGTAPHPDSDAVREQPVGLAGRGGAAVAGHPGAVAAADAFGGGRPRGTPVPIRLAVHGTSAPGDSESAGEWGPYGPAVHRWERTLGRVAPPPTERGRNGQPRLSPAFVEWMQGLPAGWVTDVPGLTRNEALKALGNGVVPQQAAEAISILLARIPLDGAA